MKVRPPAVAGLHVKQVTKRTARARCSDFFKCGPQAEVEVSLGSVVAWRFFSRIGAVSKIFLSPIRNPPIMKIAAIKPALMGDIEPRAKMYTAKPTTGAAVVGYRKS